MGKWIAVLVIAGASFGVYWAKFHKSPAYKAYLQWVQATTEGDCNVLNALAEGKAKDWVTGFCTPGGGMTVYGTTIAGKSAAEMVKEMRLTPQGSALRLKHTLESETEADNGQVSLVVREHVIARPSNFSQPAPDRKHEVLLKEGASGWKVLEFKESDSTN